MSIIDRTARSVNPTRPVRLVFDSAELGTEIQTPRPFGAGIDADPFAPAPKSPVRRLMESLGYPYVNVAAAECWLESRGTVAGCPVVRFKHWKVIDAAHTPPVAVVTDPPKPPTGDLAKPSSEPAETFPTPCPWGTFFPTEDDAAYAWVAFDSPLSDPGQARRMGLVGTAVREQVRRNESF